jgi:FAD/FMN-containing dehydrogenase/Fe-S oxidoreductase
MENQHLFVQFTNTLKNNGFIGDIHADLSTMILNATDNSIYEVLPLGVIQPKSAIDIELLCNLAHQPKFKTLVFTPRGGGTGTNGQALTSGIVVDTSRYMYNILDFNPDDKYVVVEPGVVLSELNKFLYPHGLFFAPHVSTENRATIGGMIANDAAGKGSLVYGKTNDHINSLSCILIDGTLIEVKPLTMRELEQEVLQQTKIGQIATQVLELIKPQTDEINKRFIPLKRPLSGYNLSGCYTNNTIDLTKLIAGSEGTLAFITQAQLKLMPIPKYKALVVTHYLTFLDALADAESLIAYYPFAIESIDEKVQRGASSLPNWQYLARLMGLDASESCISNFTEFAEDNLEQLNSKLNYLEADLKTRNMRFKILHDPNAIKQLWGIRSMAVGLAGKLPGARKPVAFVEDSLVPPHNLSKFVAELQNMLNKHKLDYAMYGHVDVGCIHVRPALDMSSQNDRLKVREITEQVLLLVDKYDGLLWGEHGKGFRGEFVEHTFGPILYPVMQKIKAIFDPNNRLNPGKLVTAFNTNQVVTKIDKVIMRGELDEKITHNLQDKFAESILCNGNAACFNQDASNVMCPSYKVTRDRIHSPKGRAMLVKEWMRKQSQLGDSDPATVSAANMAFVALEGCLGCKGCTGRCPTQVSIPDLRSNFYDEYYRQYKSRGVKEKLLAYLEDILLLGAISPKLWNFIVRNKLFPKFGMINIPQMTITKKLNCELKQHGIHMYNSDDNLQEVSNPVIVFADVFTGFIDHEVLLSTCKLLKYFNFTPIVLYPKVSGKAFIVSGWMDKFNNRASKMQLLLETFFNRKIPVVGLESSITLMFRDDYPKFNYPLSGKVETLAEFIARYLLELKSNKEFVIVNKKTNKYYLLPHCMEQAVMPQDAKLWQTIFEKFGVRLEVLNLGCCGMAGTYGHLSENKTNSQNLFDMHWKSTLKLDQHYIATGYSCRAQVKNLINKKLKHPAQLLYSFLA